MNLELIDIRQGILNAIRELNTICLFEDKVDGCNNHCVLYQNVRTVHPDEKRVSFCVRSGLFMALAEVEFRLKEGKK